MAFTNLEKTDMVLIYGETRGNSELARQITVEGFLERYFPMLQCMNANVVHLPDFERVEMSKPPTRRSHFTCRRRNSSGN
jgi:hypothetical protein